MTTANNPTVEIAANALDTIAEEAKRSTDGLETGGILLGQDTPRCISIRQAGGPGPNAQRGSRTFLRDRDHAQQLADAAWHEDNSQWIGEWHTHPSTDLIPSDLDLNSYLRHLRDPELHLDRFLAVIVGLVPSGGITAVTWLITEEHAQPVPLRRIND
jgi:integrative and conjugative element protein (TIGR02256 family)